MPHYSSKLLFTLCGKYFMYVRKDVLRMENIKMVQLTHCDCFSYLLKSLVVQEIE